jgi:hypothetical protein
MKFGSGPVHYLTAHYTIVLLSSVLIPKEVRRWHRYPRHRPGEALTGRDHCRRAGRPR